MIQTIEFFTNTSAQDANLTIFAIILDAVLEHEIHIVEEVLKLQILIRVKLVFYCSKIHGMLDDVEIVRNVETLGINRLIENP